MGSFIHCIVTRDELAGCCTSVELVAYAYSLLSVFFFLHLIQMLWIFVKNFPYLYIDLVDKEVFSFCISWIIKLWVNGTNGQHD